MFIKFLKKISVVASLALATMSFAGSANAMVVISGSLYDAAGVMGTVNVSALPGYAQATLDNNGETGNQVGVEGNLNYTFFNDGAYGVNLIAKFTSSDTDPLSGGVTFNGFTFDWGPSVLSASALGFDLITAGVLSIDTFLGSMQSITLNVHWDGVQDGTTGVLNVSAVPVPPALVLFLSGLVGMGFLSRRRRQKLAA